MPNAASLKSPNLPYMIRRRQLKKTMNVEADSFFFFVLIKNGISVVLNMNQINFSA
jgi:hypothetical protein